MDPNLTPPPPLFPHLSTPPPPFAAVAPPPPPVLNHPPYTQMIATAISALNEPEGSSKRAISKYMEAHFPGLPPNHSDLLIFHIKTLKSKGNIVMVKNSYKLNVPGSAASNALVPAPGSPVAASNGVVLSASGTGKRGRGRPPKAKPEFPQAVSVFETSMNVSATPVFVPVNVGGPVNGAVTSPVGTGRGRGRPPKSSGGKQGVGSPANSSGRSRGRPRKTFGVVAAEGGSVGPLKGSGRPRGRPKRVVQVNEGVVPPVGGVATTGLALVVGDVGSAMPEKVVTSEAVSVPVGSPTGSGRGRGRPKKAVQVVSPVSGAGTISVPPVDGGSAVARSVGRPKGSGRGRGRPRKVDQGNGGVSPVGIEVASLAVLGKRRGRPSMAASAAKKVKVQLNTPRKYGRPGRPRKNASSTPGSGSQLLMAYLDLKGKSDVLQSGIKQAVSAIRPCLNNEGALTALRELELLVADGDTNQQPQVQPTQQILVQPPQQLPVQPPQQFTVQTPVTDPPQPVMPQFQI